MMVNETTCLGSDMDANEKLAYGKLFNENAALTGQLEEARTALLKLTNEASGFLEMASVADHGRTNIKVLHDRILESRLFLAGSASTIPHYVVVAQGEGAGVTMVSGALEQPLHDFMCSCGQPWKQCPSEDIHENLDRTLDKDEWSTDEDGRLFSISWEFETGSLAIYRRY
jgi:hypothetical protein